MIGHYKICRNKENVVNHTTGTVPSYGCIVNKIIYLKIKAAWCVCVSVCLCVCVCVGHEFYNLNLEDF